MPPLRRRSESSRPVASGLSGGSPLVCSGGRLGRQGDAGARRRPGIRSRAGCGYRTPRCVTRGARHPPAPGDAAAVGDAGPGTGGTERAPATGGDPLSPLWGGAYRIRVGGQLGGGTALPRRSRNLVPGRARMVGTRSGPGGDRRRVRRRTTLPHRSSMAGVEDAAPAAPRTGTRDVHVVARPERVTSACGWPFPSEASSQAR